MTDAPRVLVTGATGFVGQALLDALGRSGTPVTAAVRREVPLPTGVRVCRVGALGPATDWGDALAGCDGVVHLAGRVHVMKEDSAAPLAEYRRVNVAGTLTLAKQAAAAGVKRFLFVSSIKVNGESTPPGAAFTEDARPAPLDPYGISKAEAEAGLMALGARTGMDVVVIRPPLVYGPGVRGNFRSLVRWLTRGIPLPLGSIRENRRTLVGLDNLVDFMMICLRHPAAANQIFLAGDGEDLSTTDLLRRMAAALGVRARLVPIPVSLLVAGATLLGRGDDIRRLCGNLQADIAKARRILGWTPPFSVDAGLRRAAHPPPTQEIGR